MISIITPIYNSEKFILDTVKSVKDQTVSDWQLILVDDCSTDNSLEVINAIAADDRKIIVLSSEKNSGPARTRNIGIDYAISHGAKYLAFIDSDDLWEPNFLEEMIGKAERKNADIVWCNILDYVVGHKDKAIISSHKLGEQLITDDIKMQTFFLTENPGLGSMVNKIYRSSFIEQQHTRINEERVRAEDWEFNLMLFQQSPKIYTVEVPLYHYVHQERASVMATFREKDFSMYKRSLTLLTEVANKWHLENYMPQQYANFIYNTICYLSAGVQTNQQKDLLLSVCRDDTLREVLNENISWSNLTSKHRVYADLLKCGLCRTILFLMKRLK